MTYFTKPPNTSSLNEAVALLKSLRDELVAAGILSAVAGGSLPVITSTVSSPTFAINATAGTVLSVLSAVPVGATRTVTPANGCIVLSSDRVSLLIGITASVAGTINYTITDTKAGLSNAIKVIPVIVTAASSAGTVLTFAGATGTLPTGLSTITGFTSLNNLSGAGLDGAGNFLLPSTLYTEMYFANVGTFADGQITATLSTNNAIGVHLRIDPANSTYYSAYYQPNLNTGKLTRGVPNGEVTLATFPNAPVNSITLRAVGNVLTVFVDGIQVATATDNTLTAAGYIGIQSRQTGGPAPTITQVTFLTPAQFATNPIPTATTSFGPVPVFSNQIFSNAGIFGYTLSKGEARLTLPTLLGDWTMTFGYTAPAANGGYHAIFGIVDNPNTNNFIALNDLGSVFFASSSDRSTPTICGIGRQEIRITHIAASNTTALYVNGAVHGGLGAFTLPSNPTITLSADSGYSFTLPGYGAFDCFEVSNIVRNTGAYTPSAVPPVVDSNTIAFVQFKDFINIPPSITLDSYAPGIYFPDTVSFFHNQGSTPSTVAKGFARLETAGPQIWSTNVQGLGFNNTQLLVYADFNFGLASGTTFPIIITVTDGETTKTKSITGIVADRIIYLGANVLLDTAPVNYYGKNMIDNNGHFSGADPGISAGLSGGTATRLLDPSGFLQMDDHYSQGNGGFITNTELSYPISQHCQSVNGVTLHVTGNGVDYSVPVPFWFIGEQVPALRVDSLPAYDYNQPGDIFATTRAFSDAGIASILLVRSDDPALMGQDGKLRFSATPTAGAGKTAIIRATSNTGRTTDVTHIYTVNTSTTIPGNNLVFSLQSNLNNSMGTQVAPGPVIIGTVQITGISNPIWSISALGESPIHHPFGPPSPDTPTFVITPRAGNLTLADITANFLSAQTYQVLAIAEQGSSICRSLVSITVADVNGTGPVINISPGALDTPTTAPRWNVAMDRYWNDPATNKGATFRLPGGPYVITRDPDGTYDFNRHNLGHGSNQQYPPGPYTLCGPADTSNPTIITINGAPGLSAQGGLIAQGGDIVFRNLMVKNVSNANAGEGNAGAFYKTGEQPYNLLMEDCKSYNSDNGFLSGFNDLSTITWNRCVFAFGGIGAGGLTHNFYVGHAGKWIADHILSFSTAQVHEAKSRARISQISNSVFADGQNGQPGSSCILDFPVGGKVTVTNCVLHKGPSPNNDGDLVQYCEESSGQNGPAWDVNEMILDGVTFLNTAAPGSFSSAVIGINFMQGQTIPAKSPNTGIPATIIFKNCRFYNIPRSQWRAESAAGNTVTDGGGNIHITDWPGLQAIDPSTGVLLTQNHKPGPGFGLDYINIAAGQGIVVDSLELETRIISGAAPGARVTQMFALDVKGLALTGQFWTLPSNQVNTGAFSIDSSTGIVRVLQTGLVDGLRWVFANVTGTDTLGVVQTYTKYIFVIVGTGHVPGLATPGGVIEVA